LFLIFVYGCFYWFFVFLSGGCFFVILKKISREVKVLGCLTRDQIKILELLKASGVYRDPCSSYGNREDYRTSEKILFKVLRLYLVFRNWDRSFKTKYFRNIFSDCPLSCGEARAAIRYGNKNDLLLVVNSAIRNRSYRVRLGVQGFD